MRDVHLCRCSMFYGTWASFDKNLALVKSVHLYAVSAVSLIFDRSTGFMFYCVSLSMFRVLH